MAHKLNHLFLDHSRTLELEKFNELGEAAAYFLKRDRHDRKIGILGEDDWVERELWAALIYWTLYNGNQHYTQFAEMRRRNIKEAADLLKEMRE